MIIEDFTGKKHEIQECLGCEIASGSVSYDGCDIYKTKHFGVMQDFEIPIDGFIIIAPNRHIETFAELTREEINELGELTLRVLTALKQLKVAEYFDFIFEEKPKRHLHFWLVPKPDWMTQKFGKVLKNIKQIQDYAIQNLKTPENAAQITSTCKRLKEILNKGEN